MAPSAGRNKEDPSIAWSSCEQGTAGLSNPSLPLGLAPMAAAWGLQGPL